jgi:phage gpG-like protein
MPGIDFKVELKGDEQFLRAFKAMEEETRSPQRIWPQINQVLEESVARQFNTQGAQSGGWPDLNPTYAASKAMKHPGKGILRATDALFKSLTEIFDANAIFLIRPLEMFRGTRLPYAAHVNRKRKIFAVTEEDKQEMMKRSRDSMAAFIKTLGFEVNQ